jgi:hypothetical protein
MYELVLASMHMYKSVIASTVRMHSNIFHSTYVCMHVCIACMNSYTTYCTSSKVFNNNTSRTPSSILSYYIMHNNNILHIILLLSIARTRVCI